MLDTRVLIYCEDDGSSPFVSWFRDLPDRTKDKVIVRMRRLRERGHELRRPECDFLRDGIYELRATSGGAHYRVLYFFHGRDVVVVAHGLVKEQRVPSRDIETAIERRRRFELGPARHTRKET